MIDHKADSCQLTFCQSPVSTDNKLLFSLIYGYERKHLKGYIPDCLNNIRVGVPSNLCHVVLIHAFLAAQFRVFFGNVITCFFCKCRFQAVRHVDVFPHELHANYFVPKVEVQW